MKNSVPAVTFFLLLIVLITFSHVHTGDADVMVLRVTFNDLPDVTLQRVDSNCLASVLHF